MTLFLLASFQQTTYVSSIQLAHSSPESYLIVPRLKYDSNKKSVLGAKIKLHAIFLGMFNMEAHLRIDSRFVILVFSDAHFSLLLTL